ncbi:MAG: PHP domain-containing protein [Lentisphaerae bacterium]|nr:PHP domain-containing protein [Lentisphaerota bacterium]MCP4102862.1 PHP domain-containing protein [Lentisphaerota bacterium]
MDSNCCNDVNLINDFKIDCEQRLEAARRLSRSFKLDLKAVCEIDLHCHSFYSDGYLSPAGKVFEAWRRQMKAIAICDHDVVDGQLEAIEAGEIFNIDVIPAVEFYTDRSGIEIIGHFPNVKLFKNLLQSHSFDLVCEPIRNAKRRQLQGMIARVPKCFAKLGFDAVITSEDIDRYVRNGVTTKGDISVILWQKYGEEFVKRKIATDVKDLQATYTTKDDMLNLPLDSLDIDLTPAAFVQCIYVWGGLPGLAHPTELRTKEGLGNEALYQEICSLADVGLQTIEVDGWRNTKCPESGKYQTELFEEMRQRYNREHPEELPLLFTNGSDDHNQPGEGLVLGCGRDNNLNPEFGRYSNIELLRNRQRRLLS